MEERYECFKKGVRLYLCRQIGRQDLDDHVHDLFIVVVEAIRNGHLREPERLMGFVRTVARRQAGVNIHRIVHKRTSAVSIDSAPDLMTGDPDPEKTTISNQRSDFVSCVLGALTDRDREVLIRFYLEEQGQAKICDEMNLTETQFRLLKSRAKSRFGELGKRKLHPPRASIYRYSHLV
jgi:RNA polymerase sigma factor (sigma-70 family)